MSRPTAAPGSEYPDLPAVSEELEISATLPVRCGLMPPLADRFTVRHESGPDLDVALSRSTAVALAPRGRGRDGGEQTQPSLVQSTGKTQLAVQYAESQWQARAVDLLIWADASSRAAILAGYAQAVRVLVGRHQTATADAIAANLLGWLAKTRTRWLIVLDDLQDAAVLHGLWPGGPAGRVLITTATSAAVPERYDAQVFELGSFSPREAMTYLASRLSADPDQRSGAIDLIQDLNCQPLALAQATAVIGNSWLKCVDYRDRFYQRSADLTPALGRPPAAGVTWTLSYELADRLVPGGQAQACLAMAALLDGHAIPGSVFASIAAADYIAGDATTAAARTDPVRSALTALEQSGLLSAEWRADSPLVRMNPALQRAVQRAMTPELLEQAGRAAAAALLEAWQVDSSDALVGHGLRASAVSLWRATDRLLWSDGCHPVLLQAGESMDRALLTDQAADYWTDLATTAEQLLGPAHRDFTVITERLASAYVAAGRGAEAAAWYQRVVSVWSKSLGMDHPRILAARVTLGYVLITTGLRKEALGVLTAVLKDAERAYGARDPDCLNIRDQVASGYQLAGELNEAIRLHRIVLADRERVQGPQHPDTTATRQLLADAYLAGGRTKDAFAQYKKVIADRRRDQGAEHPDTLRATAALGAAYIQSGRMAQAVQLYEDVYQVDVRVLGANHRDTLEAALSLGRVYYSVGRLTDARVLLSDTEERSAQTLGPADPLTESARQSLAAF
jgi:tetratricopeptide (TPR) repeat protein